MSDIRSNLVEAIDLVSTQVSAMTDEDWRRPTPCSEWDAHAVVDHVTDTLRGIRGMLAEGDYRSAKYGDGGRTEDGAQARARWEELAGETREAVRHVDPGQEMSGPMGAGPAAQALIIPMGDLATHAWDLADSRGERLELPDGILDGLEAAFAHAPMDQIRAAGLFGPEVEPAADATRTERVLAVQGRAPGMR